VLERVPLLEKQLDDFADVVGPETIERVRELARPLEGKRVLHINATAYGGGVAELLATHVPLLRSVGLDAEWQVMHGSDEFFAVTKQVHNGLQRVYLEKVLDNSLLMDQDFDYIVVHDPQPAALLHFMRDHPTLSPNGTKWIWRCHIDLTAANPAVWEFFRPFIELHHASVWTMPQFVPASLGMERVVHAPPCIDPLSVKNLDLPMPVLRRDREAVRHRPEAPDRVSGEPLRPLEGSARGHRSVPERPVPGAGRAADPRRLHGDR